MFVEKALPAPRERLVTIADNAPLIDVARLLRLGNDIDRKRTIRIFSSSSLSVAPRPICLAPRIAASR